MLSFPGDARPRLPCLRRVCLADAEPFVMANRPMSAWSEQHREVADQLTANERFKARWGLQLGWSTGFAAALHLVLLVASAQLVLSYPSLEPPPDLQAEQLYLLPFDGGAGQGIGGATPATPVEAAVEDSETEPALSAVPGAGGGGADLDADALREALGRRMGRRGGSALASVAKPQVDPEREPEPQAKALGADEGTSAGAGSDLRIGANAATPDLALLPEPDSLSLDRLSNLQPELALVSASAWVLIRNQPEVESFLRRGYSDGALNPSEVGTVSVTLWIDRKGSVEWAEISRSSGHPNLDEYALALFNEVADFRAAREQGVAVSRSVTFSVNFPW
jgi:TonB family protein